MGRIRTIKPDWLQDELSTEDSDVRVLSVGLILLADDSGRGKASPDVLLGAVFPRKPMDVLARAMVGICRHRFLTLYEFDGRAYYQIRGWVKHQRVDHPAASGIPKPDQDGVRVFSGLADFAALNEEFAKALEDSRKLAKVPVSRDPSSSDLNSGSSSLPKLPDQPEKPGSARARRWRKVPADWQPNDKHRELAQREGVNFERELESFRDHEFTAPRLDADGTFRNWLRNAARFARRNGSGPGGGAIGGRMRAADLLPKQMQRIADLEAAEAAEEARQ
jgi:hypothetical protein